MSSNGALWPTRRDKLAIVYRAAAVLRAITLWLPHQIRYALAVGVAGVAVGRPAGSRATVAARASTAAAVAAVTPLTGSA
jgi:hypothetical protein